MAFLSTFVKLMVMLKGKKIAVLHSHVKRSDFQSEQAYITEKDAQKDSRTIVKYLKELGFKALSFPADEGFLEKLKKEKPDFVFNLVGSVRGKDYLACTIPAVLEFLNIPYSGANVFCESLSYNKFLISEVLDSYKIPVPKSQLFLFEEEKLDCTLNFPVISKLNEIHGGVEMNEDAISHDEKHLRKRLKKLIGIYKQSILVQEFIRGREFTVIVMEGSKREVFLAEKVFVGKKNGMSFATFEAQWLDNEDNGFEYEKYKDKNLEKIIKRSFKALQMSDYGKFDVRQNTSGQYYVIDANSNPAFAPKDCAISTILGMYGISFGGTLMKIVKNNLK